MAEKKLSQQGSFNLGFKMKFFYDMVKCITEEAIEHDKEFIFVFAWNEWAESAYLEPDKRFGYAMINTFSKALFGMPLYCSAMQLNGK